MNVAVPIEIVGAILVGGRSWRMGRDKALIEVDGVPMARRVAGALAAAGIGRIVAIGPARLSAGLETVADEHPGEGPLGAILTALHAASPAPVLVVACDLPWLDAASIAALCAAPAAAVAVARTDRIEPLCALWQPEAEPMLRAAFESGERAVHRALARLAFVEVPLRSGALINVNAPHDLPSE